MVDEGVHLLRLVGVNHQSRPLVDQQQVLVLVHDVHLRLEQCQEHIFLRRLVKELVVDIELHRVALGQPLVPLGPCAVDLDALDAYVFLQQRRRQQRQRLGHKAIQPRAGVVFPDDQLPHGCTSLPFSVHCIRFWKKVKIFVRKCLTRDFVSAIILLVSLRGVLCV